MTKAKRRSTLPPKRARYVGDTMTELVDPYDPTRLLVTYTVSVSPLETGSLRFTETERHLSLLRTQVISGGEHGRMVHYKALPDGYLFTGAAIYAFPELASAVFELPWGPYIAMLKRRPRVPLELLHTLVTVDSVSLMNFLTPPDQTTTPVRPIRLIAV